MSSSEEPTIVAQLVAAPPDLTGIAHPQGTDLTPAQEAAAAAVVAHFSAEGYALPGAAEGAGALREEERFWLTYECVLRYCRATKWDGAQKAIRRLEETLLWRREFGVYDERTSAAHVEPEAVTGKEVAYGYDVQGRPALYLCPSRQNTAETVRQVEFVVFMLERCLDLMGPGVESLALMIDYGQKAAKSPSISQSRAVLHILQAHYPERLGRALIINVPWMLNAFYKLITPLVDPVTRDKMRFNPKAVQDGLFARDAVWREFGGAVEFQYEHKTYWPAFVQLAEERRARMMERWRELGARIGLREWEMKDGRTEAKDAPEAVAP
ncbi:hypothetical protein PHLGIDRAFT_23659 [Phlebiopsis gigantea 11061_1 CR5-6]|uniref:CRAL-TRIO domain-containing protein n=1 Tax=Phlebiopsis gigantea (strain 11061_1 CR5-6) TaxID=745531 RepID=A0A0C3S082_PHLG1|nr:hypothetical protein PHLGIDRAFT_23659 [Phlebiopsis gigantea 11061_1 CR5-6]